MSTDGTDAPVEVVGYITDPKLVGYQILTNYESTYWRALVGSEAWALYEVLRSFCHEGNATCKPSVKLLTSILGLKDKRVLTGRSKTVNDKEYRYPGLVEVLQIHKLAVAEVKGSGHAIRYVYHVNLTPGLLSDEQLTTLPKLLQKKHQELTKRCEHNIQELRAKRKPAKFPTDMTVQTEGGGKFPPGGGKGPRGGGKFPPEQHPVNTTHKTTTTESGGKETSDISDVVVVLKEKGLSTRVAQRLARHHGDELIRQKIDYLEFLEASEPGKITSPRGWLRRAIEENYTAPDGYQTPEERSAAAAVKAKKEETARKRRERELEEQRQFEEAIRERRAQQLASLHEQYGTTEQELRLWPELLQMIEGQLTRATYQLLFPQTQLLALDEAQAIIGVPNKMVQERLEHQLKNLVQKTLKQYLRTPVEVEFVLLEQGRGEAEVVH